MVVYHKLVIGVSFSSENLTSVKSELDTVKEMYVEMSASLGKQEEELNQEWQKKLDAFSEQVKCIMGWRSRKGVMGQGE